MSGYQAISITNVKRKHFCTQKRTKADKNVYCVFQPQHIQYSEASVFAVNGDQNSPQ